MAYFNIKDENHVKALSLIERIVKGEYGSVYTSDYIIDETLTVILTRTKNLMNAVKAGSFIIGELEDIPLYINLLRVSKKFFDQAWNLFKKNQYEKNMSFTDYTSIILINNYSLNHIASFDYHYEGIISRIF